MNNKSPTLFVSTILIITLIISQVSSGAVINGSVTVIARPIQESHSSGSSFGSSGVITNECLGNIQRYETIENNLRVGEYKSFIFRSDLPVSQVDVKGRRNDYDVALKVELLKNLSCKLKEAPGGTTYEYVNIFSGVQTDSVKIKFKVETKWMEDIGVDTISLFRWNNNVWNPVETYRAGSDGKNTYFEATTDGFSSFAIVGTAAEISETPVPAETETTTANIIPGSLPETSVQEPENPLPQDDTSVNYEGRLVLMALLLIIVLVIETAYVIIKRRKQNE